MAENVTANRGYPLPYQDNDLADDVLRIVTALEAIDLDMATAFTQLVAKASLASPAFSGTPTAPTPTVSDDSGKLATTAFVQAGLILLRQSILGGADAAWDTFFEIQTYFQNNPDQIPEILTALGNRLEKGQNLADLPDKAAARLALGLSYADAAAKLAFQQNIGSLFHGQCRVDLSGGNIVLSRHNGRFLAINGNLQEIPSAGVSLAPAAGDAVYYIYAFMDSGTMTLERSATAYAVDATAGVTIKSGDATRTLVGMGRILSSAWTHSASWFNRRWRNRSTAFTANRSTASATQVEINSEIRSGFLVWAGEDVHVAYNANVTCNTSGAAFRTTIRLDGSTILDLGGQEQSETNGATYGQGGGCAVTGLSEGFHYATIFGMAGGGATSTYSGSASPIDGPTRTSITVGTMV